MKAECSPGASSKAYIIDTGVLIFQLEFFQKGVKFPEKYVALVQK
jgi:hypothetical protein